MLLPPPQTLPPAVLLSPPKSQTTQRLAEVANRAQHGDLGVGGRVGVGGWGGLGWGGVGELVRTSNCVSLAEGPSWHLGLFKVFSL